MLVIRTADGEIRSMDMSAYLKRESAGDMARHVTRDLRMARRKSPGKNRCRNR